MAMARMAPLAIKARGGVSIVQSPADAVAPSMPTNALLHDSPDYAVLIEEFWARS
jgi:chemotaxis response regulator CheB